jgi:3-deoxy-7-phosphoheptulonate synthase
METSTSKNAPNVESEFTMNEFSFRRQWGPVPKYHRVEKYHPPERPFISIVGPCAVESVDQIHAIASELKKHKVEYLRGGVFRAGTYPGAAFGSIPEIAIQEYSRAAHENGMKCIIEVLSYDPTFLNMAFKYADAFQVGARQMQNYPLLRILGSMKRTVFLKRNMGANIDEFLGAAEHLLSGGLCDPILIERGSSTYHTHVRWDASISMIPAVKSITKIPIIIDASHGTGRRDLVEPMTLAGVAAGADGFLVEVHPNPEKSLSDADQAYPLENFGNLKNKIDMVRAAVQGIKGNDIAAKYLMTNAEIEFVTSDTRSHT